MKSIRKLHQRYTENFGKYLLVGISFTFFNVFLMWLFIDILLFPTVIGATIVVAGLFITKFYAYRLIKLINKQFLKYAFTSVGFAIANIILMWLFVDIFHIATVISSTIIVCGLFILRFIVFEKTGLIKTNKV